MTVRQVALVSALAAARVGTSLLAGAVLTSGQEASEERSRMELHDDLLLRVEERAPGFGGMFIDQHGRLNVYLLDPTQLAAARLAIEGVFGPQQVPPSGLRARKGQYTVSRLKRWAERAAGMLEMPGVTMVDLDEAKNRVAIGIEDDSRMPAVKQALASLGIPRKAAVITVTGQIRPLDRAQPKRRSASPTPR